MQKEQALKVLRNVCEKAQKKGVISSLEDAEDVRKSLIAIAVNLNRYEQDLENLKEQNEAYKSTNNELISKLDKLKEENESLKKHMDYKSEKDKCDQ